MTKTKQFGMCVERVYRVVNINVLANHSFWSQKQNSFVPNTWKVYVERLYWIVNIYVIPSISFVFILQFEKVTRSICVLRHFSFGFFCRSVQRVDIWRLWRCTLSPRQDDLSNMIVSKMYHIHINYPDFLIKHQK